jgi:hypothetical protein
MRCGGAGAGFFIGDGAGVGKGRQIAGIIMDNYARGRRQAVWLSTSAVRLGAPAGAAGVGCRQRYRIKRPASCRSAVLR